MPWQHLESRYHSACISLMVGKVLSIAPRRNWHKLKKAVAKQQRKLRYKGAMSTKESAAHGNKCRWEQRRQRLLLSQDADGAAQTKRGYRGQRIGEARHPGPSCYFVASFQFLTLTCASGRRSDLQLVASGQLRDWGLKSVRHVGSFYVEPASGQRHVAGVIFFFSSAEGV